MISHIMQIAENIFYYYYPPALKIQIIKHEENIEDNFNGEDTK